MKLRTGKPLWLAGKTEPLPVRRLSRDRTCDVAIIGAGITGALVAHQLLKTGLNVVMLDRRRAGFGSTAASTGLRMIQPDSSIAELTRRHGRRAAQRAIFHVQRELERVAIERHDAAVILCDRGTVDGLAYWPDEEADFWSEVGSAPAAEKARYSSVLCMETPPASQYNHVNPLRVESAAEAARVHARIANSWRGHPQLTVVPHRDDFLEKVAQAMAILRKTIPACCARANASPLPER